MIRIIFCFAIIVSIFSCGDEYTGFTKLPSGVYVKLHTFGDCMGQLGEAEFSGLNIFLTPADRYDSLKVFQVFNGRLEMHAVGGNAIDSAFFSELRNIGCGDSVSFIVPYSSVDSTVLDQYNGKLYGKEERIRLTVKVRSLFDERSFFEYATVMAQKGNMDEKFILEFALMNSRTNIEKHGDVYVERLNSVSSDTLRAGDEIEIEYTSFLLDGTPIDTLTTMQFPFGRPGQLIPGFQYGLSLMSQGEKARIYMPSYLAFGENGSSSGLIPPHTPLFFEVEVRSVRRPVTAS